VRRKRLGAGLVAAGVLLLAGTVLVSAAVSPSTTVAEEGTRETLVGSQGGGPGWHEDGSLYLLRGTEVAWRLDSGPFEADSYFEVTRTDDGRILAAFIDSGYEECGPYADPCARTGFRVISPPPEPRLLEEFSFPVRSVRNSEVHAIESLPSGEVLVADMDRERLLTVRNGTVTWEWNASAVYETPPDPTHTDWLHINDVDAIGEDRFLVSVRNANQLLVVERGRGVVEMINRDPGDDDSTCRQRRQLRDYDGDGDIRCGDPDVINHQHNPQWLGDGRVLVADSDNNRVVELARTDDGEWTPVWSLESAGAVQLRWPRDADRLSNGNTLVTDTLNRRIVEIDPEGEVVWSAGTELIPYEADRLPGGELVGAPASRSGPPAVGPRDEGVIGTLLFGLRAVYPQLPFWFTELQLLLSGLSVAMVLLGAGTLGYEGYSRRSS